MDYRRVGRSGLVVSELSFGTATFGGAGEFFQAWGETGADEARAMVDLCLEAGITLFDTADVYSDGASEEVLGAALRGRRDDVLISTKAGLPMGVGPGDWGTSRSRLITGVEAALTRLQTDRIDLFQLHAYDSYTPIDEVLETLDVLVSQGKIRYTGVSNFSGWQLASSLARADAAHRTRYVAHQVYYSLVGRDYEWELMPLGVAGPGRGSADLESAGLGPAHRQDPPRRSRCPSAVGCTPLPQPVRRWTTSCCTPWSTSWRPSPPRPARRCRRSR
jgi:aryl-alcohol dehydrogenase-like predicted oxidoreductase